MFYIDYTILCNEVWLSLVERCVRDAEVVGSNPVASINKNVMIIEIIKRRDILIVKHRKSYVKLLGYFFVKRDV